MTYQPEWMGLKPARAYEHLELVQTEFEALGKTNDSGVIVDFESEPGYLIVKAYLRRPLPPKWSIHIGESLYQLRSSLDHLVCHLTEKNGKVVDEHVEFPIFDTAKKFRDASTGKLKPRIKDKIGGLTPEQQAIVEREQPFEGRYGAPADDPLWWLRQLSNFDRHRFLHLVSTTVVSAHDVIDPQWFADRYLTQVSTHWGAFEGETEVARFKVDPAVHDVTPQVTVAVNSKVSFAVAFDEKGPGLGRPVVSTIRDIGYRVTLLFREFVPFLR
jgi:hypothetical protein